MFNKLLIFSLINSDILYLIYCEIFFKRNKVVEQTLLTIYGLIWMKLVLNIVIFYIITTVLEKIFNLLLNDY